MEEFKVNPNINELLEIKPRMNNDVFLECPVTLIYG